MNLTIIFVLDAPPTPVSTPASNVLDDEVSNMSSTSLSTNTSIVKAKKFSKDLIDERLDSQML